MQHVARTRRRAPLWVLSSVTVLGLSVFMVPAMAGAQTQAPAAPQAPTTGTIEICKSAAHGMAGRPFQFSLNGGAAMTVNGGACSGPITAPAGTNTVVESATSDTQVAKINSNHTISKNLATGTITVKVVAGSTPATETLVTYTNAPLTSLGLKICKVAGSPSLAGQLFSFTENGGAAFSVAAGTCGPVTPFPTGTNVNVAELATPNVFVSSITVSDNRGSNVNPGAGTVTATVGSGVTVVTYTNNVNPIPQNGYIEVCKQAEAGDLFVKGNFIFTITAPNYSNTQSVAVGQCTMPLQVPAGNVSVTEANRFPYFVSDIEVVPSGRLVSSNLANQTATVTVPVGDQSTETLVTFENATQTGLIKVCKTLTGNSGALAGMTFTFTITDVTGQHTVSVVAGAAGSTACVIDPVALPLGSTASISENGGNPDIQVVAVSVSPASQDNGSFPPTANLTVGSGITTATFTNEAFGTLEVCKQAADPSTASQSFEFSVNSGPGFWVHAGQCSMPITVPAGTATVFEFASGNFHLVSVTADGPAGDNRLLSGPTDNPATVSVPFGGVSNETVVTFTDAVNTGQFKVCKTSNSITDGHVFTFTTSYTVNGTTVTSTLGVSPGNCSGLSDNIPVVDANGNPITVTVTEAATANVHIQSIAYAGSGTLLSSNTTTGIASFTDGAGVNILTYDNELNQP